MSNNLINNNYIVIDSNDLVNIIKKTIEVYDGEINELSKKNIKEIVYGDEPKVKCASSVPMEDTILDYPQDDKNVKKPPAVKKTPVKVDAKTELGIMNVTELATYINYAKQSIYQFVHNKAIPFHKKGKKLFFKKDEIDEWMINGR